MATVLVADDERAIVDLLVELVEDAGHVALIARDGEDALILAQCHHPQLIISDVMMPRMDGYGLVHAVRADPLLAHTVIILISAAFNRQQTPISAMNGFLPKPLDLAILEQVLAGLP